MAITTPKLLPHEQADVCLILEGTYPYIRGGVSSWVHQIIAGLPEITFALLFIGDKKSSYGELRYSLPANVVDLTEVFLLSTDEIPEPKTCPGHKQAYQVVREVHQHFKDNDVLGLNALMIELMQYIVEGKAIDTENFLYSRESWNFITQQYEAYSWNHSFIDYFWTIRAMHGPLFSLMSTLKNAPKAKVYHSISTGYAGLYAVMLKTIYQRPFILTEHGIYTKERKIDLAQIEWINEVVDMYGPSLNKDFSYLRQLWIHFFETMGRLAYASAHPVIAITEGNKQRQIADGADKDNVIVITNGVDLKRFASLRERPEQPPLVIGFIGRVVPIKDVKTFLRAMRTVCTQLPTAQAWIVGGEDEDPKYARECRDLVVSLNLQESVIYKGFCNVSEILAEIGVIVLSSISEGLPLVILEAYASGLPVVSTSVGSCRELIEGGTDEDKALGCSGAVVPIANAEALAVEIIKLLSNAENWRKARSIAMQRVDKYFDEDDLFVSYRKIYQEALAE